MPKVKVTGPDGKVYTINAPDGATDEDIVQFVKQSLPDRAPSVASGVPGQEIGSTGYGKGKDNRLMYGVEDQANGETVDMQSWTPDQKARFEKMRPKSYEAAVAERFRSSLLPWQDEIVGGLAAGGQYVGQLFDDAPDKGIGDLYQENVDVLRAVKDDARQKGEGVLGFAAELGGGLLVPGGAAGSAMKSGQLLGNIGRGAKIGAGYGALYGSGEGEGVEDRIDKGLEGAAWGAGLGAALPVVGTAIGSAVKGAARVPGKVASRIAGTSADDTANDLILSRMEESRINSPLGPEKLTPKDLQATIRQTAGLGYGADDIPVMLADMSEPLTKLTGSAKRAGGAASEVVESGLLARQLGTTARYDPSAVRPEASSMADIGKAIPSAYKRVVSQVARALDLTPDASANTVAKEMSAARKVKATKAYNAAYQAERPFVLKDPVVKLVKEAQDLDPGERAELIKLASKFFDVDGSGKPTRLLGSQPGDLKKFQGRLTVLSDDIGKAKRAGDNNRARILTQFKQDLLANVDRSNVTYGKARKAFSDDISLENAIEAGRMSIGGRGDVNIADYDALSPMEQRYFQLGMFDRLKDMLGGKVEGADMTALFRNEKVKELLNHVIPKKNKAWFNATNQLEGLMKKTEGAILGNSKTAERLGDDAKLGIDTALGAGAKLVRGDVTGALYDGAKQLIQKFFGFRSDVAEALARKLTTMDKGDMMKFAVELDRIYGQRRGSRMVQSFLSQASAQAAGPAGGVGAAQMVRPEPRQIAP